jgi:hypothetical protein
VVHEWLGFNWVQGSWFTLASIVLTNGFCYTYFGPQGYPSLVRIDYDADLATGGALATGQPRFGEYKSNGTAENRDYDNFAAWTPDLGHSLYSGQDFRIESEQALHEHTADVWDKVDPYGSYMEFPPNRTTRAMVLAKRKNTIEYPDDNISDEIAVSIPQLTPRVALL